MSNDGKVEEPAWDPKPTEELLPAESKFCDAEKKSMVLKSLLRKNWPKPCPCDEYGVDDAVEYIAAAAPTGNIG